MKNNQKKGDDIINFVVNSKIILIHGYLNMELEPEEIKMYEDCLSDSSKQILVVCKPKLKTIYSEYDLVTDFSEKLENHLTYSKKIRHIQSKEENESITYLYDYSKLNCVKIVDRDYVKDFLNQDYKKIILAGYYNPQDGSFLEALGL